MWLIFHFPLLPCFLLETGEQCDCTRDNVTAQRHTSHLASRCAPLLGDSVWLRKHLTDGGLQKCDVIRVKHNEVWKLEIIKQPYFTALSPECLSSEIPGTDIWKF